MYRAIAESAKELEAETKIHIPIGGPSTSWWFRGFEGGNSILVPEKSLMYKLIKFCYQNKLPLDFISWHAYSTDPKAEKEITAYNKTSIALIRDWLSYFDLQKTVLIVDEWNYDSGLNISEERKDRANISASYIPSRIRNMFESGIDYQIFFALEDFHDNKEGVDRNVGVFQFNYSALGYQGVPKSIQNVFRMLSNLGTNMYIPGPKFNDEFVGVIATVQQEQYNILIYNYIDPEIFRNFLSRGISMFNESERAAIVDIIKSAKLEKILKRELDIDALPLTNKVKTQLKKALELHDCSRRFAGTSRGFKLNIKNLKDNYTYERFTVDSSCNNNCAFSPVEQKVIDPAEFYQESLLLQPYSVQMIVMKKKPKETLIPAQPEVLPVALPMQEQVSFEQIQEAVAEPEQKQPNPIIQEPAPVENETKKEPLPNNDNGS
jgi:hypothetical protein